MRQEFAHDIECAWTIFSMHLLPFAPMLGQGDRLTPHGTKDKLDGRILLLGQTQTQGNRGLPHHDRPNMMHRADMADLDPVQEFENVHADEHLRAHDQYVPERDARAWRKGRVESGIAEGDIDKGIRSY